MKNKIEPSHYDESEIFLCDCSDVSHQMVFQLFDFGKDGERLWCPANSNCELSMHVFLNDYPRFWRRLWLAIKYIFGYKSKFGHFDTVSLRYEDIPRLKAILDKFVDRVDEYARKLTEETESEKITREISEALNKCPTPNADFSSDHRAGIDCP